MVRRIIQGEGLAMSIACLIAYLLFGGDLPLFAFLFMTPDLATVGYLRDDRWGALIYDLVHNYGCAVLIILAGLIVFKNDFIIQYGFVLASHISLDRFLGFGLKYPNGSNDSHIQKV